MSLATYFYNIAFSFLLLLSPILLLGQVPSGYSCLAQIEVDTDENCSYTLDPNSVLIGDEPLEGLKVFIFDTDPSNRAIVDCPGRYNYTITNDNNAILCWGYIQLNDNAGPRPIDTIQTVDTLECVQINRILNNPSTVEAFTEDGLPNKYYLGEVLFKEDCFNCNCEFTSKFFDQVDFYACDSLPYFARITRKWTAVDCNENKTEVDQLFYLVRPSFDSLNLLEDISISTCSPDSVEIPIEYPFWIDTFGDTLYLNELDCNIDAFIEEFSVSACDSTATFIDRYVKVFDWCTGESIFVDTLQIRIGDFDNPVFSGNAYPIEINNPTIALLNQAVDRDSIISLDELGKIELLSTGPMDCTIGFSTSTNDLEQTFGFNVIECQAPEIEISIYTFGTNPASGIPLDDQTWRLATYNTFESSDGQFITGLPPGLHAMQVTASDQCFNSANAIVFFAVEDQIAPILKCEEDLDLSLSLSADAFPKLRLNADEVDETSSDNCNLDQILIRRQVPDLAFCMDNFIQSGYDYNQDGTISEDDYIDLNANQVKDIDEPQWEIVDGIWFTPWQTYTDFFCCDLDQELFLELMVFDLAFDPIQGTLTPNSNTCQLSFFLEDPSTPSLNGLDNFSLDCSASILNFLQDGTYSWPEDSIALNAIRSTLGSSEVLDAPCNAIQLEERIERQLDNCGVGNIIRTVVLLRSSRSGVERIDSTQQSIEIKERYDYWIKFPKDIRANCTEGIVDSATITLSQNNCDLLAISYTDDFFYAPQDEEACFKIFRTFQVINWCEYNGTSAPVVVSRDWDTWNGFNCYGNQNRIENYNTNPIRPDGNDIPGDSDLFIIVRRNFNDAVPDTVYIDADSDPNNGFPDNINTVGLEEAYWWKILSGPGSPEDASYYESPIDCGFLIPSTTNGLLPNIWGPDITKDDMEGAGFDEETPRYGSYGFWQYTQHITVIDDQFPAIDIEGESIFCTNDETDCSAEVALIFTLSDQCQGSGNLELSIFFDFQSEGLSIVDYSSYLTDSLFKADFPIGQHQLILEVDDNCGNVVRQNYPFIIRDCTGPTPICKEVVMVELSPVDSTLASATIWPDDLIAAPTYDCSGQGPEENDLGQLLIQDYSINIAGEGFERNQSNLIIDCRSLDSTIIAEVHAWDDLGQHNYCRTVIMVEDNAGYCNSSAAGLIAGAILTEDEKPIGEVEVILSGFDQMLYPTDDSGAYAFDGLTPQGDYTVKAELNAGFQNGISTLDILLIQKHILGTRLLESPYQMIAADANNSKAISTLDLIIIRKLILNIDVAFENNTSWRFIPENYVFTNPNNPWQEGFPEFININKLPDTLRNINFIGIKIGDVNGSASTIDARSVDKRSNKSWNLHFEDKQLIAGQIEEIPFWGNPDAIEGLQFEFSWNPDLISVLEVDNGLMNKQSNFSPIRDGSLIGSWIEADANISTKASMQNHFFKLKILAKANVQLSNVFGLERRGFESAAYEGTEAMELILTPTPESRNSNQNLLLYPNPFHLEAQASFYLENSQDLSIQIIDTQGKLIHSQRQFFQGGKQVYSIDPSQLTGPGIYYLRINGEGIELSQRMIYF